MSDEIIATVEASPPRRWFGILVLGFLGLLLIYVAFAAPPAELAWQVFLVVAGAGALITAERQRRASQLRLELTDTELRDSDGNVLATLDQIKKVDRGLFTFKPSNGFLVLTHDPQPRHWAPGLWWRNGRRIGVGGVTSAAQNKAMAEILSYKILERDGAV